MRLRRVVVILTSLGVLLPVAVAQTPESEGLPSAPSATRRERAARRAAAPPQPAVSTPSPAAEAASQPSDAAKPTETGQANAAQTLPEDSAETIRRTVNEVNVVFTVSDRHGHFVKDLKRDDFRITDDNRPPEEIRSFHSETDLPLQVGLLVDASNSIRDRFKFEQESAIEFLSQTIRPRYDKAFVIGFDVTPEVTQDFTDDTEALSRGVRNMRPGGGTAMYDAIYYAARDKLLKAAQSGPVRRAIILVSDGDDNQSHVTREEAIDMAQRADVAIYTISTNLSSAGQRGDRVLERIADATGGRAFFPFQIRDVASAFAEIQNELRSQYALSYKPADFRPDGRYRTIEIVAKDHKNLRVRSKHGYYAPAN